MLLTYKYWVNTFAVSFNELSIALNGKWTVIGCTRIGSLDFNKEGTIELSTEVTEGSHVLTMLPCSAYPVSCKSILLDGKSVVHIDSRMSGNIARKELVRLLEEYSILYLRVI